VTWTQVEVIRNQSQKFVVDYGSQAIADPYNATTSILAAVWTTNLLLAELCLKLGLFETRVQ
jgi:hypothetical protein